LISRKAGLDLKQTFGGLSCHVAGSHLSKTFIVAYFVSFRANFSLSEKKISLSSLIKIAIAIKSLSII
jgi:hypothetical protein